MKYGNKGKGEFLRLTQTRRQCVFVSKSLYKVERGFTYLPNIIPAQPSLSYTTVTAPTYSYCVCSSTAPLSSYLIPIFFSCFTRLHHTFSTMLSKSFTANPFCSQFLLSHPFLHVLQFTSVPFSASVIRSMDKKTFLFPNHICTHVFYSNNVHVEHCCLHSMCQGQLPIDAEIFKIKPSYFTHFSLNPLNTELNPICQ